MVSFQKAVFPSRKYVLSNPSPFSLLAVSEKATKSGVKARLMPVLMSLGRR